MLLVDSGKATCLDYSGDPLNLCQCIKLKSVLIPAGNRYCFMCTVNPLHWGWGYMNVNEWRWTVEIGQKYQWAVEGTMQLQGGGNLKGDILVLVSSVSLQIKHRCRHVSWNNLDGIPNTDCFLFFWVCGTPESGYLLTIISGHITNRYCLGDRVNLRFRDLQIGFRACGNCTLLFWYADTTLMAESE